FTRIGRFFKAIFNAVLGEAEAQMPVSMLEQSVREMLENLRVLREATATTIAFETKGKRELDAQNARVKNLDAQAEEALRQGNEISAMDTIAVSEGDELDRQLAAISKKSEVDSALEALKARLGEAPATGSAAPAKAKEKVSSAFDEK